MEKIPNPNEQPNLFESAEKFSSAMDKIELAREGFFERIKKSRELLFGDDTELNELNDEELRNTFSNFETDKIEDFLKKENDQTFINRADFNKDDLVFEEPDSSTLIDSKHRILQRGESTSYSEDADQKIDLIITYRIGPLGTLEIMTDTSQQKYSDSATPHPAEETIDLPHFIEEELPEDNDYEFETLSLENAKKIANFMNIIADFISDLYSNPDLEIMISDNNMTRYEIVDASKKQ